jgi:hypothetical protein
MRCHLAPLLGHGSVAKLTTETSTILTLTYSGVAVRTVDGWRRALSIAFMSSCIGPWRRR